MYMVDLPQTRPFSASSPVPEAMDEKVPWICTSTARVRHGQRVHQVLLLLLQRAKVHVRGVQARGSPLL